MDVEIASVKQEITETTTENIKLVSELDHAYKQIKRQLGLKIEESEAKAIVTMKDMQEANAKKNVMELELRKYKIYVLVLPRCAWRDLYAMFLSLPYNL